MRDEVSMLVRFVTENLIKNRLPSRVVAKLTSQLTTMLYTKYNAHWHTRNPLVCALSCCPYRKQLFAPPAPPPEAE